MQTEAHPSTTETPIEAKQPLPKDAKFQRRGFKSSEDVEREGLSKGERPPADPVAANEAVETAEHESLPEEFSFETPGTAHEPNADLEDKEPVVASEDEDEGYTIGDKHFKTQKEAFKYAEELRLQQIANDAWKQGVEAAQSVQNSNSTAKAQAEEALPEKMPDEYYTNPEKWWAQERQRLSKQAEQIATRARNEALQEVNRQTTHNQTMSKFWNDFPDLAKTKSTQKLTERILGENFKRLENMKTEDALKIVARLAREELRDLGVTILPQKTLPSTTKPAASPGNAQNVTRPKPDEKPLNFIQQMKQTKLRRAALSKK